MKGLLSKKWVKNIIENDKKVIIAILFLIIGMLLTIISGDFVDDTKSVPVPDLILDHIPVIDLSGLFVYGIILVVIAYFAYPLFYKPQRLHYVIGMASFFLCIRAGFQVLTHLQIPSNAVHVSSPSMLKFLNYSNDLFFSGHAGFPFLGFLIFENKIIKFFMLFSSILLGCTVLLMHVHYSIDVASAYFITYGIYSIGHNIFGD